MARAYTRHDWTKLDPLLDRLIQEEGYTIEQACKDLGIKLSTYRMHQRTRESGTPEVHQSIPELLDEREAASDLTESAHLSTPESTDMAEVPQSIPQPQGTLEGYEEVMEDVQHSVPELGPLITDEEDPSTPEVHPEMSPDDSTTEHSGVPARQGHGLSTPMVHQGTPTAEDWELWNTIKARWLEVEKMLADRQAVLSTPTGTPGHTQKKTYVFDTRHIALIDRYAEDHRIALKDVLYAALQEFFERRGYLTPE